MALVTGNDYAADLLNETIDRGEDWVRTFDLYADSGGGSACSPPTRGDEFVADAAATLEARIRIGEISFAPADLYFIERGVALTTPAQIYIKIANTVINSVFREGVSQWFDWQVFYILPDGQEEILAGRVGVNDGAWRP